MTAQEYKLRNEIYGRELKRASTEGYHLGAQYFIASERTERIIRSLNKDVR